MPPTVLNPDHVGIRVQNLDAAIHFYRDVLGLPLAEQRTMPNGTALVFLRMGATGYVELIGRDGFAPAQPVPGGQAGLQHFCLQVEDLDAWVQHLAQHNVPLTVQPFEFEVPSGTCRGLFIADPEGNPVELMQRNVR